MIGDRPGDLGEGEGQHGEIDAGKAYAEPAEDERAGKSEKDPSGDRRLHAEPERLEPDGRAIRAEAKIGCVSKGDETAAREQKMEARRIEHEDQHFRRDADEIIARDKRQKRRDRQSEEREKPTSGAERPPARNERAARAARGRLRAPEQSPGPYDEDDRHDEEDEDDRDLGEDEDAEGVELRDDDRGEEGAWHAAEAADHDDDQRLGDHLQVHRVVGRPAAAAQAPRQGRRGKRRERRRW